MKKKQNNKMGTKAMCACGGIGTLNTIRTVQNESVQQPVLCIVGGYKCNVDAGFHNNTGKI
jgi:hypothetical protein